MCRGVLGGMQCSLRDVHYLKECCTKCIKFRSTQVFWQAEGCVRSRQLSKLTAVHYSCACCCDEFETRSNTDARSILTKLARYIQKFAVFRPRVDTISCNLYYLRMNLLMYTFSLWSADAPVHDVMGSCGVSGFRFGIWSIGKLWRRTGGHCGEWRCSIKGSWNVDQLGG
jgi:hypothetical protein